jgi:hypothetical protein
MLELNQIRAGEFMAGFSLAIISGTVGIIAEELSNRYPNHNGENEQTTNNILSFYLLGGLSSIIAAGYSSYVNGLIPPTSLSMALSLFAASNVVVDFGINVLRISDKEINLKNNLLQIYHTLATFSQLADLLIMGNEEINFNLGMSVGLMLCESMRQYGYAKNNK